MSRDSPSSFRSSSKRSSDKPKDKLRPAPRPRIFIVKPSHDDIVMSFKDGGDSDSDDSGGSDDDSGESDDDSGAEDEEDSDDKGSGHPSFFFKQNLKQVQDWELLVIRNSSTLTFNFTGTAVAVIGKRNEFPPVPEVAQPKWNCTVRSRIGGRDQVESNSSAVDHPPLDTSEPRSCKPSGRSKKHSVSIPEDAKQRMCQCDNLGPGEHELRVEIDVRSSLPAYLHSIRYKPSNETSPQDVSVRIDASDTSIICEPKEKWRWPDHDSLQSIQGHNDENQNRTIEVSFQGNTLLWYGTYDNGRGPLPSVLLDDKPYNPAFSSNWKGGLKPFFNASGIDESSSHRLKVVLYDPTMTLTLHHLIAKIGSPQPLPNFDAQVQLIDQPSATVTPSIPSDPTGSKSKQRVPIIVASVVGAVLGLLILLLGLFWWVRSRGSGRARWKAGRVSTSSDSTYGWPASKVSTRSSFCREAVSGDIEYNPKAEKKMEGLRNSSNTRSPPPAIILHRGDSGVVIQHLPAREIPPRYSYI